MLERGDAGTVCGIHAVLGLGLCSHFPVKILVLPQIPPTLNLSYTTEKAESLQDTLILGY